MSISAPFMHPEDMKDRRRRGEVKDVDNGTDASELLKSKEIRALARRVFGSEAKADAWLHRPNTSMSGQIPLDLLKDALGAAVVRETLEQIDNGIFA